MSMAFRLSFFLIAVISLLGWLLPNHYPPWLAFFQDSAWFSVVFLLAFNLLCKHLIYPPVSLIVLILALVPLFQLFSGIIYFFGDAIVVAVYILGFSFALMAGYSLSVNACSLPSITQGLAGIFLLGALLSLWIALRQWFLLSGSIWVVDLSPGGRPFANLGQPNNLATLFGMGLAAVIYFYEKRQLGRISSSLLTIVLLFGIALTQSRTPWLTAVAVCLFWAWKANKCNTNLRTPVILLWTLVFAALVLTLPAIAEFMMLSGSDPLQRIKSVERWDLYKQFYYAVIYGPLWGYGWNQVSVAQVAITPSYPVALMTEYTHNIILDLLIWNGPILGSIIIVATALWLGRLAWTARSSESLFALLAAGFVFTHSMLEYPHAYAYFLLPLGLLLGIAQAEDRPTKPFIIPRQLLVSVALAAGGLGGWIWSEYRVIEEDFRLMRFETANIGNLKAEQTAPDVTLLTQLREFTRFTRTEASEVMSEEELEWMRKVAHRYPYLPSLFRYSYALALNYRTDESFDQLLVIRGLYGEDSFQDVVRLFSQNQEIHPQLALLTQKVSADRN